MMVMVRLLNDNSFHNRLLSEGHIVALVNGNGLSNLSGIWINGLSNSFGDGWLLIRVVDNLLLLVRVSDDHVGVLLVRIIGLLLERHLLHLLLEELLLLLLLELLLEEELLLLLLLLF